LTWTNVKPQTAVTPTSEASGSRRTRAGYAAETAEGETAEGETARRAAASPAPADGAENGPSRGRTPPARSPQAEEPVHHPTLRATLGRMAALDTLGRPLRDLRISVTDRCNFRCVYCMPKEVFGRGYRFMERRELLTFEEIERVVRAFAAHGLEKVRITGGEPLLRRDLEQLIARLAAIDGLDLTLTTNGALLEGKAQAFREAGLRRVTVSLDALDDETFRAMNDVGFPVERVLAGIRAAAAVGLPVKVNTVVKRGLNDDSVLELARYFKGSGHIVRFIEYMDVGATNGWRLDDVVPAAEIVRTIDAELPLEPAEPNYRGEVARRWRYRDGTGEIGVIASVTQPFCGDCTRARLSAEGRLYTCLFAVRGHDLRALLRSGAGEDELRATIGRVWARRRDRYSEIRSEETASLPKVEMSYIGG
jgi:cyclic pyranopterin phosphate synthase